MSKPMTYMEKPSKMNFSTLGDLEKGRQSLGSEMPVMIYRLFQYSLKDILSREFDEEYACDIYRAAGHQAGICFARGLLDLSGDFDFFITELQRTLLEMKIGILRIEKSDINRLEFVLTVSEDLDCSGLPVTGETVCDYDEGFIAGIFEAYTNRRFKVKEIDCWASGARTCRFAANPETPVEEI